MLRLLTILLTLVLSAQATALETDNYIVWRHQLQDASRPINDYLRRQIEETLPHQRGKSCAQVTAAVAKKFASYFVHDDPIAQHLLGTLTSAEMFPTSIDYVSESIYRDPFRFYIPKFGLAPNIQVRGFYFGIDKLSHFGATGKHYFDAYQKAKLKGASDSKAIEAAIAYGIREENTLYGYWASGVYSFADLEANYQGLLFYQRLCSSPTESYLRQLADGSWQLRSAPDIARYVNAYWDESFNLSYFLPKNWKKVRRIIGSHYCSIRGDEWVREREEYYHTSEPSYSVSYLRSRAAQSDRDVPNPQRDQSVDKLCREFDRH